MHNVKLKQKELFHQKEDFNLIEIKMETKWVHTEYGYKMNRFPD
jgi:hypothetical protein